jgi:hypothetical protein
MKAMSERSNAFIEEGVKTEVKGRHFSLRNETKQNSIIL